jgi:hypothetical protein
LPPIPHLGESVQQTRVVGLPNDYAGINRMAVPKTAAGKLVPTDNRLSVLDPKPFAGRTETEKIDVDEAFGHACRNVNGQVGRREF